MAFLATLFRCELTLKIFPCTHPKTAQTCLSLLPTCGNMSTCCIIDNISVKITIPDWRISLKRNFVYDKLNIAQNLQRKNADVTIWVHKAC